MAHAMNASGQETGCSFWFHRLNDVLVLEVNLIHQTSFACHFTQFSHVRQLLLLNIHLPAWHCPGLSSHPLTPTLFSALCCLQGLDSRHFPWSGLWGSGSVREWLVIELHSSAHLGCTRRALTHTFPINVCLLALDTF